MPAHSTRPPIFVYQMGKVGSCSVQHTVAAGTNHRVVHGHCLPEMAESTRRELAEAFQHGQTIHVISPVRDPISRNVSAFFQNFERDVGTAVATRDWSVDELLALFLQRYPHRSCLEWFDEEFRPHFGLDVFDRPFAVAQKWQVYERGPVRLLVYRTDLDLGVQLEVISSFLGHRLERWVMANCSADKSYGPLYREFCRQAVLPESYLQEMGHSRYFRHFWSEPEIAGHVRRWRSQPGRDLVKLAS